jgi:hypothetical protein
MRSVPDIIQAAGGTKVVADRLGLSDGVKKWRAIGIPYRHWPQLIEMVPDLTTDELMQASLAARRVAA